MASGSVVQAARQELRGEYSEWAPLWRRPSRGPGSRSQSAEPPSLTPLAPHRPSLLKPRSRSPSEGSTDEWQFDSFEVELERLEQELQDKQLQLTQVKANGRDLEEKLEATQDRARHFSEAVLALEAGLSEAEVESEQRPAHREPRTARATSEFAASQPSLDNLVDEWARARAAIGFS